MRGGHEERDKHARLFGLQTGPRTTTWHGHVVGPHCLRCARECNVKTSPALHISPGPLRFDYCHCGPPRRCPPRGASSIFKVIFSKLSQPDRVGICILYRIMDAPFEILRRVALWRAQYDESCKLYSGESYCLLLASMVESVGEASEAVVSLSIVQGRAIGVTHYLLGGIATTWASFLARIIAVG
ncbi:hypothetical protein ZIOFF_061511 [Zingiber officinale]|uniref:Uncharacterized protein n=1 Tax=Zingiber officinale TaxID=94328 RepID=A0A8J5KEM9_ZINOF|nr:hypothetical protein ZIOFF_061511 [Zingiber officinale]